MRPRRFLTTVLTTGMLLGAAGPLASGAAAADEVELVTVASGLASPLLVTAPGGDDRLFIVERAGRILVQQPTGTRSTFADLRVLVGTTGEGGLLGLAFSPTYQQDGRFWVHYTDTAGDTRVDRLTVSSDRNVASNSSRVNVLAIDQPYSNHNGGSIEFANDDMLLVALGDGGSGGDPDENGQDTDTLLGTILRLDVVGRAGGGYAIPADNPRVGRSGRDEIWAYGLRNPYRLSVDRSTGDVWVGDVGQSAREEVNRLAYPGPSAGYDLGWDCWEGTLAYEPKGCPSSSGVTFPTHEYGHINGACSITGGYVVRGPSAPRLAGQYVFGDFCSGVIEAYDPGTDKARAIATVSNVFSFGTDGVGNVYVLDSTSVRRIDTGSLRFTDVTVSSVYRDAIERLAAARVTRGCNPPDNDRYCPSSTVTRGEMAAFITRAAGLPSAKERFVDVADDHIFASAIGALAARGITKGCNPPDNDRYCPDNPVTRGEMAAFIQRTRGWSGEPTSFVDVPAGHLFSSSIGALESRGITRGCNPPNNDRYCPEDPVTREQMAVFLVRAFDL